MRFLHTADWHIGKKLNNYDLLADQEYILDQLIELAVTEAVDAIVIAGDLYDRSVPAVDAVKLFNRKIIQLNLEKHLPILAISGNHDSGTRLEAGSPWYSHTKFFLHTRLEQAFTSVELEDVQFFLLPYFEPIEARLYFDADYKTIAEAMQAVVEKMVSLFDPNKKQVLVSHFFVAGSSRTDSEIKVEVGGLDAVPVDLLAPFDYVALGHLHSHKALHAKNAQYSGSLLKFSTSELNQEKGVYIVDTATGIREFQPLAPLHEMEQITASFNELLDPVFYQKINQDNYLVLSLTDRAVIPNVRNRLREVYPRILSVDRLNGIEGKQIQKYQNRGGSPAELVKNFFHEITDNDLTPLQEGWLADSLQQAIATEKRE